MERRGWARISSARWAVEILSLFVIQIAQKVLRQAQFEPTKRIVFHALERWTNSCPASKRNPGAAIYRREGSRIALRSIRATRSLRSARRCLVIRKVDLDQA